MQYLISYSIKMNPENGTIYSSLDFERNGVRISKEAMPVDAEILKLVMRQCDDVLVGSIKKTKTMQEKNTVEGNRLIAEFDEFDMENFWVDGYGEFPTKEKGTIEDLEYHTSWDWLMPAWAKFVALYHDLGRKQVYHPSRKLRSEFVDAVDRGDISKCHEILVEGITWYNSTNPQK